MSENEKRPGVEHDMWVNALTPTERGSMTRYQDGPWRVIYQLQESTREHDGLSVLSLPAATVEAAKILADERLGRWADLAQPWTEQNYGGLGSNWQRYVDTPEFSDPLGIATTTTIPRGTWQHIMPTYLVGEERS